MQKQFRSLLVVLLLIAIFTVGCSNSEEPTEEEPPEENEDENNNNNQSTENKDSTNETEETTTSANLPDDIEMNERIKHPNDVIFTLEAVRFGENYITVEFHAQNAHEYRVYLADDIKDDRIPVVVLEDDTGFEYPYLQSSENEYLKLEPGERISASLTFMGKVNDDATSLSLTFNPEGSPDDEDAETPQFNFTDIDLGF